MTVARGIEPPGADPRELGARRARALALYFVTVAEMLDSTDLSNATERALLASIQRVHLAISGLERAKDGARREWVVSVLETLGALLEHFEPQEAWDAWLELQCWAIEPDGPFPDLAAALVDNANSELALRAARALSARPRTGRKRAGEPLGSSYLPLNELFSHLPDGAGGSLRVETDANLRKLVERARKKV